MSKLKLGYLGIAAVIVAAGCADERPPRSFVQPNVIKKADLDGTWHYIQTVTEAPVTNGSAFQGQSSSLMKIRFEVQEDHLYAKRAIEHIEGSEDGFWHDPGHYKGQILASWRISSQFDVIRDYNSTTGEQTNKIIESQERPWNQREFIRVDWSQNEVTDYVGIGLDFFFSDGQPNVQNVSYWVSDPTHPDALHLERAGESDPEGFKAGEANYLDVTNQVVLTPDLLTATYQEDGRWHSFSYPKCFFGYEQDDCASQRVKIRHGFAKIGPAHDVEPRLWDGKQMELFGVWDVGQRRMTYNRQYGVTNSGFRRHAARFNIWKQSCKAQTVTDDKGNSKTFTPEACEHDYYMKDGVWTRVVDPDKNDPRIPPAQRDLKPVPYYATGTQPTKLSDGTAEGRYPEEIFPEFADIIGQWNAAMKVAVADIMQQDPMAKYPKDAKSVPDVFLACHNPVKIGTDPQGCLAGLQPELNLDGSPRLLDGQKVYRARQGDPRRSQIFWVNEQQNAGPLGYGPPLYDEETGETVSGQAYIYGAAVDTYATRSRDLMLLQNGELSTNDYTSGQNVKDYVSSSFQGTLQQKLKPAETHSDREVALMAKAANFDFAQGFTPDNGYGNIDTTSNQSLKASLAAREDNIWNGYFGQRAATGDSRDLRISRLVGKPLEKMMIAPENLAVSGVSPMKQWDQLDPIEQVKVSPIREKIMNEQAIKERLKAEVLGVDFETFDDAGLAQRLRLILHDKTYCPNGPDNCMLGAKSEKLRQDLRKTIYEAVTLHEVGHNMGCRHNFRASYDAMNYFPDYWKVRTEAIDHPDQGMAKGDGRLHARYVNMAGGAVTQYELDHAVREAQYSSIMDYGAEFNSDLLGLGLYDKALIKFSYAEMVEVFNKVDPKHLVDLGAMHTFQNSYGLPTALAAGAGLKAIPYTHYPQFFLDGDYKNIGDRSDVPRSQIQSVVADASMNTVLADDQMRPLVPYFFCSDEFVGNLSCQRFDAGPDPYEQATDLISRYENFYIYNNFKRDRASFHSSLGYKSRIAGRYFNILREQLTWYVLLRADFESFTTRNCELDNTKNCPSTNPFFATEDNWGGFTLGVALGMDTIGKTITRPTIGLYGAHNDASGQRYWRQFNDDLYMGSDIGNFRRVGFYDGKYIDTKWDFEGCGYYWGEECQTRIGYMVDKQVALDVLSESQAYFTGRDTNTDVRQYAIGYIIPFKAQIEEKFGALFAGDLRSFAPFYGKSTGGADLPVKNRSWVLNDPTDPSPTDTKQPPTLIDPSAGFTVQLYAGVYGMAAFPTTFDRSFIENTKVFVIGNGEATISDTEIMSKGCTDPAQLISNGGTKEWLYVTDAASGKSYAAHAVARTAAIVPDPATGTPGNDYNVKTVQLRADAGIRMLEHLYSLGNTLQAMQALDPATNKDKSAKVADAQNQYDLYRQNIEVMRSLHNAFGYGTYKTDAPFYY